MEAGYAIAATAQMHGWIYAAFVALVLAILVGAYHLIKSALQRGPAGQEVKLSQ